MWVLVDGGFVCSLLPVLNLWDFFTECAQNMAISKKLVTLSLPWLLLELWKSHLPRAQILLFKAVF